MIKIKTTMHFNTKDKGEVERLISHFFATNLNVELVDLEYVEEKIEEANIEDDCCGMGCGCH